MGWRLRQDLKAAGLTQRGLGRQLAAMDGSADIETYRKYVARWITYTGDQEIREENRERVARVLETDPDRYRSVQKATKRLTGEAKRAQAQAARALAELEALRKKLGGTQPGSRRRRP